MPFPFPPIARPAGNWKDIFDNQAIDMSISHNMFIRGVNSIYAQAEGITEAQVKPFVFYCIAFLGMLHHHHHIEETLLFPFYESKLGENTMGHNVEQHAAFMSGLEDLETYLNAVQDGTEKYSGATIIEKLNSFTDILVEHLRDEIPTLESSKMRAAFTEKDLHDLEANIGKRIMAEVSLITTLPLGLICHDKSTADYFPPLPKPLMWVVKYGLYKLHSDAWAFGPCDVNGVVKPGLGNDLPVPMAAVA
ncbi:Hemerythrin domain-containing protein [Mycena indigotica]|uniref:Hemerythrin domain-containing protein n=1 Tax=Mycena indigotica TaxID=2126181 RepID=A0A8H6T7J8_9AGAR|nr:Hemerythrin domain-containing protein [Mycena indigotica]KAF7312518.1 Hemerythrin domain-containing protein [Mycena indigotica]